MQLNLTDRIVRFMPINTFKINKKRTRNKNRHN